MTTNTSLDDSPPTERIVEVLEKTERSYPWTGATPGGIHYDVTVPDWHAPGTRRNIPVDARLFHRVEAGSRVAFTTRSGYRGYEWVVKAEILK